MTEPHPRFTEFLNRALQNPEVRAAYESAKKEHAMPTMQQNSDGSWSEAKPLPYLGWKARFEQVLRRRGLKRFANFMAAWDERGLGR